MNLELISNLWRPANFRVGKGLRCGWQFEAEQILPWELFRGQLLGARQTRLTRRFLAWNLLPVVDGGLGAEPILSLLLDEAERCVHMTRGFSAHVWETNSATLEACEVRGWTRELIGSLSLDDFTDENEVQAELRWLIEVAIVGTSRLPLTSVEAPLPAFALGQLAYLPRTLTPGVDANRPLRVWSEILDAAPAESLDSAVRAKRLEAVLRAISADEIDAASTAVARWLDPVAERLPPVLRRLFNDVSLSPYTDFVDNTLAFVATIFREDPSTEIDFLSFLLRHLSRHLTAYDLVLFHSRGANYPDALLLDAVLRRFIQLAEAGPSRFFGAESVKRRRALLHGILLRRRYEGHAVPDAPTSSGENQRILPAPFERVPDVQILQPQRRRRQLFVDSPTSGLVKDVHPILRVALEDLEHSAECRELGMALFIDRPLGYFKEPAEPDATPLLSYEAFSRRLATAKLHELERLAAEIDLKVMAECWAAWRQQLEEDALTGVGMEAIPEPRRPAVSLADARKVADDFRIVRTTSRARTQFWQRFDTSVLPWTEPARDLPLVVRVALGGQSRLHAYDSEGRLRLAFEIDPSLGFVIRLGVEAPCAGLTILQLFDATGHVRPIGDGDRLSLTL